MELSTSSQMVAGGLLDNVLADAAVIAKSSLMKRVAALVDENALDQLLRRIPGQRIRNSRPC